MPVLLQKWIQSRKSVNISKVYKIKVYFTVWPSKLANDLPWLNLLLSDGIYKSTQAQDVQSMGEHGGRDRARGGILLSALPCKYPLLSHSSIPTPDTLYTYSHCNSSASLQFFSFHPHFFKKVQSILKIEIFKIGTHVNVFLFANNTFIHSTYQLGWNLGRYNNIEKIHNNILYCCSGVDEILVRGGKKILHVNETLKNF